MFYRRKLSISLFISLYYMNSFFAFMIIIVLVGLLVVRLNLQPFLSLLISAIVYGLMLGMSSELIGYIKTGLANVFSTLAIIIFCGAIIAEYLRANSAIDRIVADLILLTGRDKGLLATGFAGYLVSVPVMCCITTYLILEPVMKGLGERIEGAGTRFQLMLAVSSVISFNLIYPAPVMLTLTGSLGIRPIDALKVGLPVSILLLALMYIYVNYILKSPVKSSETSEPEALLTSRIYAWGPFLLPIILILIGLVFEEASFIGSPNIAILIGAIVSLGAAGERSKAIISTASRRAGVILLDLCGAGALGHVISESNFAEALQISFGQALPLLVTPFLISAMIQLAQGSRVVTVVIAAEILAGYPIGGLPLALLICAGAFVFSFVSDPYFWFVSATTEATLKEMIMGYTLPLTICGAVAFGLVLLVF